MTCTNCGRTDLLTGVGDIKIRGGVLRCVPCDRAYLFRERIGEGQGELELKPESAPEAFDRGLADAVAIQKKKVRVPQVCSACGFVEGPAATRMDQVFDRYGRLLCRQCRKKNRDGTARRRGRSRRGG